MPLTIVEKNSGNHKWGFTTGEATELRRAARILKAEVKHDRRGEHLDLTPRQERKAVKKLGAVILGALVIFACAAMAGISIAGAMMEVR